jgi:DNA-binding response OmpR family regulator
MMRVLLVDDEEELVSTLSERLALRGIDSDWATSGEEGMRLALANDYDWVVLDLKMPGLGGLATLKAIKSQRPASNIIVLTGHSAEEEYQTVMQAGASHYLLKPLDVEDLIAKMQGLAGQQ